MSGQVFSQCVGGCPSNVLGVVRCDDISQLLAQSSDHEKYAQAHQFRYGCAVGDGINKLTHDLGCEYLQTKIEKDKKRQDDHLPLLGPQVGDKKLECFIVQRVDAFEGLPGLTRPGNTSLV